MNRWWFRIAAALLVVAVVVAAALTLAWNAWPLEGTTVRIDGESFSVANLGGAHAVAVFAIVLLVALAVLVLGALGVVIGLAAAAIGIAVGVLATAASLALVASPFLLVGWLVWRLLRKPAPGTPVATA